MQAKSWAIASLIALAVGASATWLVVSGRAVDGVTVAVGWPSCIGTEVSLRSEELASDEESFTTPAVPLTEDMECTLLYRVENSTGADLRISRLIFPFGGRDGGAAFEVASVDGIPVTELPDDVDAIWTGDVELPADGAVDIPVEIRFREDGCTDRGSMSVRPTVVVNYLGRSREVSAPASPIFLGTADSTCRGTATGKER